MQDTIERLTDAYLECLALAEKVFNIKVDIPDISFSLKGLTNGQIGWRSEYKDGGYTGRIKDVRMEFNAEVAHHNIDRFIGETIPHEIAHYIDLLLNGKTSHDRRWKTICILLGGSGERCSSYNRSMLPNKGRVRKMRKWLYRCGCQDHLITTVLHNKMRKGYQTRSCVHCGQRIYFIEPVTN